MPIYEFKCPSCGKISAKLSKMGESGENLVCPDCQTVGLVRQISGFASPGLVGKGNSGGCSTHCGGNCSGCHS